MAFKLKCALNSSEVFKMQILGFHLSHLANSVYIGQSQGFIFFTDKPGDSDADSPGATLWER